MTGSILTRQAYLRRDLDTSNASFTGAMLGASTGPLGLVPLCMNTPEITTRIDGGPGARVGWRAHDCLRFRRPWKSLRLNGSFVASQIVNGLVIGIIYGFMALGLTLIFSILGVVSFAHGEFYMIGGMITYFLTAVWLPGHQPGHRHHARLPRRLRARRSVRAHVPDPDVRGQGRQAGRVWHPGDLRAGFHNTVFRAGNRGRQPAKGKPLY